MANSYTVHPAVASELVNISAHYPLRWFGHRYLDAKIQHDGYAWNVGSAEDFVRYEDAAEASAALTELWQQEISQRGDT